MMMMMMIVFLQSKLSCDAMFFLTCRRVSLEKKIERGLRKKYDRHLGRQKKEEKRFRGATNNNDNNEKGGRARTTGETMYILIRDTKTNTFSHYKKFFFKLFYKKKTFGKASGRKRVALPPFTSQPSSGGLFISTYDVYTNQPHFSLISSKQLFFSLKRGKRTV